MMRKLIAMVLALALVCGTSASAQITVEVGADERAWPGDDSGNMEITVSDSTGLGVYQIEVYELSGDGTARLVNRWQPSGMLTDCALQFDDAVTVRGPFGDAYDMRMEPAEGTYQLVVTYGSEDGMRESFKFFADPTEMKEIRLSDIRWYPANHATAFGPNIADSWRTYAIVDVGFDGRRTIPLVAAGAWNLGNVYVNVIGDSVVVDYRMHEDMLQVESYDDVTVTQTYVNIYPMRPGMADIEEPSRFRFGEVLSIEEDLGGEKILALYVELEVDYPSHSPCVYRFWPNMPANRAVVASMEHLWQLKEK